MYRTIYEDLLKWKNSSNRKPLIMEGARQVGKTWIIKEFGEKEYKNIAYINCDNNPLLKDLFIDFDMDRIIMQLSVLARVNITPNDTLIFLDEIQELEKGLSSLKYFYENKPEYHVIVAGSLLGLKINQGTGFPVGKVDTLRLEPLSFKEFLLALNNNQLVSYIEKNEWKEICSMKTILSDLLRQYYYVGGMPEVVFNYVQNKDFLEVRQIQNSILQGYERDFSKHTSASEALRISEVYKSIPKHLAKENKKFMYSEIKKGARSKQYEEAITWLQSFGLIRKVNRISKICKPIKYYEENNCFKVYFLDLGLLGALVKASAKDILVKESCFSEYKGSFSEQFVIQQYCSLVNNDIFYYSNKDSTREIDFVLETNKPIIIEVKSEENLKSKSFSTSLKENSEIYGWRFSMSDYIIQERMTNIPLYLCYQWFNYYKDQIV